MAGLIQKLITFVLILLTQLKHADSSKRIMLRTGALHPAGLPPSQLSHLQQLAGVAWVGDYLPDYKIAPEAQRLSSFVTPESAAALLAQQHSADPTSAMSQTHPMSIFVHQAADGSAYARLDVAFPHHLPDMLGQLQTALELCDSSNSTRQRCHAQAVQQQLGSFHPAHAGATDWEAALNRLCDSRCSIAASGAERLVINVPVQHLQGVLHWLAAQPQVHWISPRAKTKAANFFATGISQVGYAASSLAAASWPPGPSYDNATHPFWDAGLQGQGQTVGMGDTGIDWLHCAFKDSSTYGPGDGPYQTDALGYKYWVSAAHRKISYYRQIDDNVDGNGHGTHCAGSAVGSLQSPGYTGWQGMAPQSQIAFTDIGSGQTGTINAPSNLATDYFLYTYNQGARVTSDSWGTSSATYDAYAYDVDLFAWYFQGFLPVYAAGNFGYEEIDSTISSPAVAKNCLAVGASLTASYSGTIEQEAVSTDSQTYQMTVNGGLSGSAADDLTYTIMLAYFGSNLDGTVASGTVYPLVAALPADGCSALRYANSLPGKVVLLQRGNCTFQTKVYNAQRAGAYAALVYNNANNGFVKMTPDSNWNRPAVTMPSASIPASTARPLLQALLAGASLTVTFGSLTLPSQRWASLAFFSSIGPTLDGRYKPDIIVPGTTISPYSNQNQNAQNCALGADRGTSMSTPVAAGAVALVRQYFMQGWYPTGAPVAAHAYTPSGPLLKAIVMGGAVAMNGLTPDQDPAQNGVPLDAPPSIRQGFGRLQLNSSLPLAGVNAGLNLQIVDQRPMTATGISHKYCVTSIGGPLKITLVWADRPPDPSSSVQLVNDLDLTVYADSLNGYGLLGNGIPDHVNNVEQVSWNNLGAGLVVITVSGFNIPFPPQTYALVVQGSFTGQLQSVYNPSYSSSSPTTSCSLPVARITSSPAILTNNLSASWAFSTSADPAPNGFQCKLSGAGGSVTPSTSTGTAIPLHDWATCSSPVTSTFQSTSGSADGAYLFQVRARDYTIQDARIFTLSTTLPVTSISSFSTPESFSQRSAAFSLASADNRSVSWECQLTLANGLWDGGVITGLEAVPTPGTPGSTTWQPCDTTMEYLSLPAGGWTFQACATDLAGNLEGTTPPSRPTKTWTVALPSSYAIITGGDTGALYYNNATIRFGVYPNSASVTYQCRLEAFSDTGGVWNVQQAFSPCVSPKVYGSIQAGSYRFSVMLSNQNGNQAAQSLFQVLTEGPSVKITVSPPSPTTGQIVAFKFVSETAAYFQCRWDNVTASSIDDYANCTSPAQRTKLSDGKWVFQVVANTASGVPGSPVSFPFLVDSTAPTITQFMVGYTNNNKAVNQTAANMGQLLIPASSVTVYLVVSDGLLGSGVASNGTYCRLQPAATKSSVAYQTCRNAMRYSGLQGTNTFEAIATDQAGNQNQFNASIVITDVEIQGASSMAVHWDYVTVLVLVAAVFFST